jgi:hypothetical protein
VVVAVPAMHGMPGRGVGNGYSSKGAPRVLLFSHARGLSSAACGCSRYVAQAVVGKRLVRALLGGGPCCRRRGKMAMIFQENTFSVS